MNALSLWVKNRLRTASCINTLRLGLAAACLLTVNVSGQTNWLRQYDNAGNTAFVVPTNSIPVFFSQSPPIAAVIPGQTLSLTAGRFGGGPFFFQWQFGGTNIIGATSDSLLIPNFTTNLVGQYCVSISNSSFSTNFCFTVSLDSDHDGLPDTWEKSYFGSLYYGANDDTDHDGVSNYNEFLDGTNPNNANSFFPRLNLSATPGGTVSVTPLKLKYQLGDIVQITAIPNAGKSFLGWVSGITNANPTTSVTMDRTKTIIGAFGMALGPTLDATNVVWITGGDGAWFGQTGLSFDGISAARSGEIGSGQQSWIQTTVVNTNWLTVTFAWRTFNDGSLSFYINDALGDQFESRYSVGDIMTFHLKPGTNTLKWVFNADSSQLGFAMLDRVQIKTVSVQPGWGGGIFQWQDNDFSQTNVPGFLANVIGISAGLAHKVALIGDGRVFSWQTGSLGTPADLTNATFVGSFRYDEMALRKNHTFATWGLNRYGEITPPNLTNVLFASCGGYHGLASTLDGKVIGWGYNSYGQISIPSSLTNVEALAAGYLHSLALRNDGTVVGWGDGSYGKTAIPSQLKNVVSIAAGYNHSVALRSDGTVSVWGDNSRGQTKIPPGLSNLVAIAAGDNHTLALRDDGRVFIWGSQSNVPPNLTNVVAIAAGGDGSLAITNNGSPWIIKQPAGVVAYEGVSSTLQVLCVGNPLLVYNWRLFGTNLPSGTNAVLTLNNSQPYQSGIYDVVISNYRGSVTSMVANVSIIGFAPVITTPPQNKTIVVGSTVTFDVSAKGFSPLGYQWQFGGTNIAGATGSQLTVVAPQFTDAGNYTVVVTNSYGQATSSPPATLTVKSPDAVAKWAGRQRDGQNTGRVDFQVPADRTGSNFFGNILWQKQSPGSPNDGSFGAASMVYFDGVGPNGADIIIGAYHWPKGVQGMDRHTGKLFWFGNPEGGESIGENTPAISPNGRTVYVINDATTHPLMAFGIETGPSNYWHNGANANPSKLGSISPKTVPDGRIFAHGYNDRPYAASDNGTNLPLVWSAASSLCEVYSVPAFSISSNSWKVIAAGRCGDIKAFDGVTGAGSWSVNTGLGTDADPTVDPVTGNVYVPMGFNSIAVAGLKSDGTPLWGQLTMPTFLYQGGINNPQRAQSAGCLSFDGATFYFQTVSQQGDGELYAIDTSNGSLKWAYKTQSRGWEEVTSCPVVTKNNVIIVGNNEGGTYYALHDDGTNASLLAMLPVAVGGQARNSATISQDGILYLPARLTWSATNGDNELPTQQSENLFSAFDLNGYSQNQNLWAILSGHQFILSWSGEATLQSATNVAGPYFDIPDVFSPFTNEISEPSRFYRLRFR